MATTAPTTVPPTTMPAQPVSQPASSLYVGDIAAEISEAMLFELFNKVGPVASVRVCRDAATRRSLGYAYVNYHRSDDAERALDTLNFTEIAGRPCRIMWSHRDPTLRKSGVGNIFVKNLAKDIDNKTLYDTFSRFGNILSCKIATNSKRESLGYGFVHFESEDAAKEAILRVNGMILGNQQVEVSAFKSKKERGGAEKNKFTNVYVKNLPEDTTDEKMRALFTPFGNVTSAYLNVDPQKKCRGFGFVNFETAEMAQAAISKLHGAEQGAAPGKKLFVCRAQKKEEREKELRDRFESIKAERQKKQANLYIKNLADTIDDNRLRAEFAKFGNITSAKVMVDEKQKSRGFGFVCFASAEEATKAVTEMNNKMIENKPLYVALAQRKEYRRAQLEAQYAARQRNQANMMYVQPQGPMFYPPTAMGPIPPNARFYPAQQQMGMRGPWPRQPGPQMMMRQPGPASFQLVPAPMAAGMGAAGVPPRPMQNGRGGGNRPRNQGQRQRQAPNQVGNPQMNIKYQPNAQNIRPQAMGVPGAPVEPVQPVVPVQAPQEAVEGPQAGESGPLTVEVLAAAPPEAQKQMLGERLFPLVQQHNGDLAGKITGMLLEMENGELLHLIENGQALREKVQEALDVLAAAGQQGPSSDGAQESAAAPAVAAQ